MNKIALFWQKDTTAIELSQKSLSMVDSLQKVASREHLQPKAETRCGSHMVSFTNRTRRTSTASFVQA